MTSLFGVRQHVAAFLDATCRGEPKRGRVRALQSRISPGQRGARTRLGDDGNLMPADGNSLPVFILGWTSGAIGV